MISVDEVYKRVEFISDKKQSGSLTPEFFNRAIRMANEDLFREKYGLDRGYANPNGPVVAYEKTTGIKDDMRRFVKTTTINKLNSTFPLPEDYVHVTGSVSAYVDNCSGDESIGNPIEVLTDGEWSERVADYLTKPTEKHPIGRIEGDFMHVLPATISSVKLTYLSQPKTPVWAYQNVNDEAVFDSEDSVDFDWPEILTNEITRLVLVYIGVNLRDDEIIGYARQSQQLGS